MQPDKTSNFTGCVHAPRSLSLLPDKQEMNRRASSQAHLALQDKTKQHTQMGQSNSPSWEIKIIQSLAMLKLKGHGCVWAFYMHTHKKKKNKKRTTA